MYLMEEETAVLAASNKSDTLTCCFCGKLSKSMTLLNNHLKRVHKGEFIRNDEKSDIGSYLCADCGKQYATMAALIVHRNKAHLHIKPYQCTICAASFSGSSGLCQHRKTHQTDLTHKCTECGKLFKFKQSLLTHSRIHSNSKEFACSTCKKHFTQKSAMIRHQRIHSGDRPFRCSLCLLRFADISVLRRHCLGVHNILKFKYDPKLHFCETSENDAIEETVKNLGDNDDANMIVNEIKPCFIISGKSSVSVLNQVYKSTFGQQSLSKLFTNARSEHCTFPTSATYFEHFVSDIFDMAENNTMIEHNETPDVVAEETVNSACVTCACILPVSLNIEAQDSSQLLNDLTVSCAEVLPINLDISESLATSDDAVCF